MSHALHANYTFNQDEFITAQNYHARFSGRRMRWLRWAYLGITVVTVTVILLTQEAVHPMLYVVLAMGYIGVIAAEVLQHPKMLARAIKKRFDEGIYQSQKVAFILQDDSITTTTNGNHEKRITWDEFQKIVETPDGFLMYLNKQVFLWLPLSALHPADSSDTLRTIWREYKLEYARVK